MSQQHVDPSGNTVQFRAFVSRPEPPAQKRSVLPIVMIAVIALLVVAGLIFLIVS
jgi:hypothetical protein